MGTAGRASVNVKKQDVSAVVYSTDLVRKLKALLKFLLTVFHSCYEIFAIFPLNHNYYGDICEQLTVK